MQPKAATENSITIQWHPDLLGRLCELVFKEPKPEEQPKECGGLLLGTLQRDGGRAQIIVRLYTPISCSYEDGQLFHLSTADRASLRQSIARYESPYWSCIGFYRSHCRPGLELDAEDLRLAEEHLGRQPGIFLLLSANVPHGGLFRFDGFRFSMDPAFILPSYAPGPVSRPGPAPTPGPVSPPAGRAAFAPELPPSPSRRTDPPTDSDDSDDDDGVLNRWADLAGQLQEFAQPAIKKTSAVLSRFVAGLARKRMPGWLVCTLILLVIGFVVLIRAERKAPISNRGIKNSAAALTHGLGLVNSVELDHVRIAWNPHAPAVASATSGTLSVTEGQAHRTIALDKNVLAHGSVAYYPTSDVAAFELRIGDITESLVAVGLDRVVNVRPSLAGRPDDQKGIPQPLEEIPESAGSTREAPDSGSKQIPSKPVAPPTIQPAPNAPPTSVSTRLPPLASEPSRSISASVRPGQRKDLIPAQPIKRVFPGASGNALKLLVGSVTIQVRVHIDSRGRVVRADSLSHGGTMIENLSELSVNAAREWLFAPARRKGRDVESDTVLQFVFDDKGTEKPSEN